MTEQAPTRSPSHVLVMMTRYGGTLLVTAALGLVAWVGACSDRPCISCPPPPPPPTGLISSDPVTTASTAVSSSGAVERLLSGSENTVYITLLPGTVPTGSQATAHVVGSGNTVITSVVAGGFDPVPIAAGAGDSIEVVVSDQGGTVVARLGLTVSARRPPVIVRTEPPPRKRDVPLNSTVVVIFSEPVAESSLTASSVKLFSGSARITGSVRLVQGSATSAVFTPAAPLRAQTDFRLVVTTDVKDLQGDALEDSVSVGFTTGQSLTGPPASLIVGPSALLMVATASHANTYQMTAIVRDAAGNMLTDQPVTWTTTDANGLTVSATGLLTALAVGSYQVTAAVGSLQTSADVLVTAGPPASGWVSVSAFAWFTCGITTTGAAYCWGYNSAGQLGNGTRYAPDPCIGGYCSTVPLAVTVTGARTFTAVTGFEHHACGLSTTGEAYCWGGDYSGELGLGSPERGPSAPVDGGLTFSSLSAGGSPGDGFSCGVTSKGDAYCWGSTAYGQRGNGSTGDNSRWPSPQPVAGGLTFTIVSSKQNHSCGLTTSGAAYCWGDNRAGQLGIGITDGPEHCYPSGDACSTVPVAVSGGLTFTSLSVGVRHACGLTSTGAAYCWGFNSVGPLGDGSTTSSSIPVAVVGGLAFSTLSAGSGTCGVTTTGAAYCWGAGSTAPVLEPGGLTCSPVSAGAGDY